MRFISLLLYTDRKDLLIERNCLIKQLVVTSIFKCIFIFMNTQFLPILLDDSTVYSFLSDSVY